MPDTELAATLEYAAEDNRAEKWAKYAREAASRLRRYSATN